MAVAAFLVLFLIPMVFRAAFHSAPLPGFPRLLSDLQALSCLFSYRPDGWSFFYVQVRRPGERGWTTIDHEELFGLEPFGHRSRLHRLLQAWKRRPGPATEEVATWFFSAWERRYPDEPPLEAVRFAYSWVVPDPAQPPPHGWRTPDWNGLRADRRRVIAVYERPP